MTQANYSLEVISHHPQFKNKNLRKYYVDGIDTVGAWGDEPFEIKFTNHSWQKVQVKISLDGTDVLSGATANTSVDNNMWVVNAYGTMTLKAWPETNNGGAQFVFTSANNSVAVHTHGDLSARGIIAVAVFVEGQVPTYLTTPVIQHNHYHHPRRSDYWYDNYSVIGSIVPTSTPIQYNNQTFSSNTLRSSKKSMSMNTNSCSLNSSDLSDGVASAAADRSESRGLESLVSVGAGQHVDQKINYVQGLVKPILAETVRLRYMWWDELQVKLRENNVPAPHASGFPGDHKKVNINLGGTPRIGGYQKEAFPRAQAPVYARV